MESVEAFNIDGQTTGLLPVTRIKVEPGCKGFVAATVNAALHQLVVVDIFNTERHYRISSMTFYGQGERVQMKNAYGQDHWSFGPLEGPAVVQISVLHRRGTGLWIPSKTVGPLTIIKRPEDDVYNKTFYHSTVISEDAEDSDHDDCTVHVLQYK